MPSFVADIVTPPRWHKHFSAGDKVAQVPVSEIAWSAAQWSGGALDSLQAKAAI
jgi:hypothetical protein